MEIYRRDKCEMTDIPFKKIWETKKMPNELRKNILVPHYMSNDDIQNCSNYHRKKLMCNTIMFWERIIKHRILRY